MATVYSPTHPNSIAAKRVAELIKRRSNGEIIPEYYPSSQLGDNNEITEGLINGSIDISIDTISVQLPGEIVYWSDLIFQLLIIFFLVIIIQGSYKHALKLGLRKSAGLQIQMKHFY